MFQFYKNLKYKIKFITIIVVVEMLLIEKITSNNIKGHRIISNVKNCELNAVQKQKKNINNLSIYCISINRHRYNKNVYNVYIETVPNVGSSVVVVIADTFNNTLNNKLPHIKINAEHFCNWMNKFNIKPDEVNSEVDQFNHFLTKFWFDKNATTVVTTT